MKHIKTFVITYEKNPGRETREWPGKTSDHAVKRFQRSRELSNQPLATVIAVDEVKHKLFSIKPARAAV